ncbi:hypothetical protein Q31b_39000 [Novipirellula aureliae]|uniref:NAD(P)-binding domain-containing protein n=1 Tax=Novipirellula aureliae TaxID=2527966 RepID=A0A5C6DQC7_9BACT|nr:hypothetical protein Q31b_39000 [Novipirellula aureliae]
MTTLVIGATGATGRLVVEQLLDRGQSVKAILRVANRQRECCRLSQDKDWPKSQSHRVVCGSARQFDQ